MMKGLRYMLVQWLLPNLMAFVLHVHGNNMIISWRLIFVHCRLFTHHMFMYMDVDRINSVIIIFYCMKCFPWAWHTISPCHQRWVHYSPVGSVFVWSHLWFDETVQCSTDKRHTPAHNFDYLLPSNHRHFIIHGSSPSYFYSNDKDLAEWSLATLIQFYWCFNDGMMKYMYMYVN